MSDYENGQDRRGNRIRNWSIVGFLGGFAITEALLWGGNTSTLAIAGIAVESLLGGVTGAATGAAAVELVSYYPDEL